MLTELYAALPWNKRMKFLRNVHELTQVQAARKCLTCATNYIEFERGFTYPNLKMQGYIAGAYGMWISEIFSVYDKKIP